MNQLAAPGNLASEALPLPPNTFDAAVSRDTCASRNPAPKLDLIRRERLEIYGNTEIRGVCMEKLLEGFEEFTENT